MKILYLSREKFRYIQGRLVAKAFDFQSVLPLTMSSLWVRRSSVQTGIPAASRLAPPIDNYVIIFTVETYISLQGKSLRYLGNFRKLSTKKLLNSKIVKIVTVF